MAEWFQQLESYNPQLVEEAKQKLHEQFNLVKESWLLNGVYEFYISTNSVPSMEILINIREPHHNHLFDRLDESIRSSKNDSRVQALTLLGHVVLKHPTWLYKITQHTLLKDLLKLLKIESDILVLVSALLVLIVLLPCIPAFMKPYLLDVFEIFSRLAAWNCNNPAKLVEEQMVHMQVGLYALFQRLYGMYPCNFLTYLREHYRNASPIFTHTIKPMLQTVQMHPLLVTNSKDFETTTDRWKKMEAHDVVMECERFSLDLKDRFSHDTCFTSTSFRSRSGTTSSTFESPYQFSKILPGAGLTFDSDFFSPSQLIFRQTPPVSESSVPTAIPHPGAGQSLVASVSLQSQEGTSPPEAAIEATPETTPIKDIRLLSARQHPQQTSVARALNTFGARNWSMGSANTTPTHSQPSSPMRKDASSFNFPSDAGRYTSAFGLHKRDSYANQRLQKLMQERSQSSDATLEPTKVKPQLLPPTSPLRVIPTTGSAEDSVPNSPLPSRLDSPVSQEDEEVLAIVRQGESTKHPKLRQCDSVLHDVDGGRTNDEEIDECEHGSPCTSGGLHMPNSKQMTVFRFKMQRLRYHSQCGADGEQVDISTGSSPGNSVPSNNMIVRRANSCPEMKKDAAAAVAVSAKEINRTLEENDEEINQDSNVIEKQINGFVQNKINDIQNEKYAVQQTSTETQTENFWPMPYEHLFLNIFPSLDNTDVKPSPAPSPAPYNLQQEKPGPSFHDILDRYITVACQPSEKLTNKAMKEQIQLLQQQLLFERHRRETHAIRNRTLFTDVTKNKVLQEHNSALTDQVKLQERNIDELKSDIEMYRKDKHCREIAALDTANYWETKCKELEDHCRILEEKNKDLHSCLSLEKNKVVELDNKWQIAEASLLDATAEVKIAKEQVLAGERGRVELEQVNKELLLAGELILKYQERMSDLHMQRRADQELTKLTEEYIHEIKSLQHQLESKVTALESCRMRISELEHNILQYDEASSEQKKILNEIKEECHEKLKAIESKYQAQLSINRTLEGKILELYQQIETTTRRGVHSPDTSSCHEVNATFTDRTAPGLSPHSSPLSASLASSEGSVAFMHPSDVKDMKNLQMIADEKEPTMMKSSSTMDSDLCQELPLTQAVQQQPQQTTSKND